MKRCKACGQLLAITEFYVHPETADGYLNRCKECVRERVRNHRSTPSARRSERAKYQSDSETGKLAARRKVHRAIKAGRMTRLPCEVCGEADSHAHHEDYSRPLDVRWLCSEHHGIEHRILTPKS